MLIIQQFPRPQNMSPEELQLGTLKAKKQFSSLRSILKRLSGNLFNPFLYLILNFIWIKEIRIQEKKHRPGIGLPEYLKAG